MHRLQESDNEADDQQSQEFMQLMNRYQRIFSTNPGKIKNYQCQMKVKEGEPIYQRPYPIPMAKMVKNGSRQKKHHSNLPTTKKPKAGPCIFGIYQLLPKTYSGLIKVNNNHERILKKEVTWDWTEQHQEAFEKIKQLFLEDLDIQYPNFNDTFYLSTSGVS